MIDFGLLFLAQDGLDEESALTLPLEDAAYPKKATLEPLATDAAGMSGKAALEASRDGEVLQVGAVETSPSFAARGAILMEGLQKMVQVNWSERVPAAMVRAGQILSAEAMRPSEKMNSYAEREGASVLSALLRDRERRADIPALRQAAQGKRSLDENVIGQAGEAWDMASFDRSLERDARRYDRGFLWPG